MKSNPKDKELSKKIVILASPSESTWIVYRKLCEHFSNIELVVEKSVSTQALIKNRIRKLGWLTVAGQLVFQLGIVPLLRRFGKIRSEEIKRSHNLQSDSAAHLATHVPSVNSPEARKVLQDLDPCLIIVNGTRIIGARTLGCVPCPFINMHAGITPKYRGVHGGYWALFNDDRQNAGTTIHFVDKGIDTGDVIAQERFESSVADNFTTYPWLQLAVGVPALIRVTKSLLEKENCPPVGVSDRTSKLYYHPTFWTYVKGRLAGVK